MKRFLLFSVFLISVVATAQSGGENNSLSLLEVKGSKSKDSLRVEAYHKKFLSIVYSEPKKAKTLARKALQLSKSIKDCYLIAKSFNHLGIVYDVTSKYDSAIYCYNRCLQYAEKCDLKVMKAQALNNVGLVYWNKSDYDKAIEFYTRSLELFEESGKTMGVANTLSNIGIIYGEKHEYEKSLAFYKKAYNFKEEYLKNPYALSALYSNLSLTYSHLNKLDSAKFFLKESMVIKDSINDKRGLAINYNEYSVILSKQEKIDSAIFFISKAIDQIKELDDRNILASDYYTLAGYFIKKGEYSRADKVLSQAEEIAKELELKRILLGVYDRQMIIDTLTGSYKDASRLAKKRMNLHNELFNLEKEEIISNIQAKYETTKKEKELAEHKAALAEEQVKVKNRTNGILLLCGVILLIGISAFFVHRQQKLKQEKIREEARLREELSKAELQNKIHEERVRISRDLHDHIGSQLTVITSSLDGMAYKEREAERRKKMEDLSENARDAISQLRETIWAMNNEAVDLDMFTSKLREYTQKIRSISPVKQVITIKNEVKHKVKLSPAETINLFRICQESITNAVKYADFSTLEVSITEIRNRVTICIADNGKGFNVEKAMSRGYGLTNMQGRAQIIGSRLNITSEEGKGSIIKISFVKNQSFAV